MEASSHSHDNARVIDIRTGELVGCQECATKDQAIARLTRSYEGTIRSLKDLLDDKAKQDPRAAEILSLGETWCELAVDTKFWKRRPAWTENTARWKSTAAAMNRGHDPAYLRMVILGAYKKAVEARKAYQQRRTGRKFERGWLEPKTIFGDWIHSHYEYEMDPPDPRAVAAFSAPKVLFDRWLEVVHQADKCDCGHIRFDHEKEGVLFEEFFYDSPCLVHGCTCLGFDDFFVKQGQWEGERNAQAKQRDEREQRARERGVQPVRVHS